MSIANTAYFANGFAVGGMMDSSMTTKEFELEQYIISAENQEKLRRRNAELERELADIKESYSNVLAEPCESDDRVHCTCVPALRAALATKQTEVNKEHAEADRLRLVLVQISSWGCNGQCVELVGTQCPCCIAKAALKEEPNGKATP